MNEKNLDEKKNNENKNNYIKNNGNIIENLNSFPQDTIIDSKNNNNEPIIQKSENVVSTII